MKNGIQAVMDDIDELQKVNPVKNQDRKEARWRTGNTAQKIYEEKDDKREREREKCASPTYRQIASQLYNCMVMVAGVLGHERG